jgi:hypothetical protein
MPAITKADNLELEISLGLEVPHTKYLIISQLRQQFRLMLTNQWINDVFQTTLHDVIQFIQG